jgi:hypothetical protein
VVAPLSRQDLSPQWPPNAKPSYRPTLIAAIAASAGVVIGSLGPWAAVVLFTINGLDASWWGVTTLMAGALAAAALVLLLFWSHTTFAPRWSVAPAWLAAVLGVDSLIYVASVFDQTRHQPPDRLLRPEHRSQRRMGTVAADGIFCSPGSNRRRRGNTARRGHRTADPPRAVENRVDSELEVGSHHRSGRYRAREHHLLRSQLAPALRHTVAVTR